MTGGDRCSVSEWCDDGEIIHTQGKVQASHGCIQGLQHRSSPKSVVLYMPSIITASCAYFVTARLLIAILRHVFDRYCIGILIQRESSSASMANICHAQPACNVSAAVLSQQLLICDGIDMPFIRHCPWPLFLEVEECVIVLGMAMLPMSSCFYCCHVGLLQPQVLHC